MFITIEGNIGAGKSTLCKYLKKHVLPSGSEVHFEQVEQWRDYHGHNLLDECYKGNIFPLQLVVPISRPIRNPKKVTVSERCPATDRVFQRVYNDIGYLSDLEEAICHDLLKYIVDKENQPDLIIYIKATPEQCLERCKQRGRDEESEIDLEFLKKIDEQMDQVIDELNRFTHVVVVSGNLTHEQISDVVFGKCKKEGIMYQCEWCDYSCLHCGNMKKHMLTKKHVFTNPLIGDQQVLDLATPEESTQKQQYCIAWQLPTHCQRSLGTYL